MEYLWKSSLVLILFYSVYKLFLERETFFQSIRGYLLIGIISSIAVPLIVIKKYVLLDSNPSLIKSFIPTQASESAVNSALSLPDVLMWVYFSGLVIFSIRFIVQLYYLIFFLRRRPKKRENGYFMILNSKDAAPFSFFNYIVYPDRFFEASELQQILTHEKTHADHLHSADVLLTEILCVFQWFNPVAWLYQKEVQKNLEYIADEASTNVSSNRSSYEYLLLKTIQPEYKMALTSNFYNSLIKKRIQMLQQKKSNKFMYLKFALILPLLFAFLLSFNTKVVAQQPKTSDIEVQIDEEVEIITKDFSKPDLESLKGRLLPQGIEMKYKKLKYNASNEITGISLTVSNDKGNTAQLSQSSSVPINPISIRFDKMKGSLALGNINSSDDHNLFIHENDDDHAAVIRKKIIIDTNGNKEVIVIGGDSENSWINEDVDVKVNGNSIWVSDSEDSTHVKHIRVIELDEDDSGESSIFIKKGNKDADEVEVLIHSNTDHVINEDHSTSIFIQKDGDSKPLMFIDGEQIDDVDLKDMDSDKIETIEVLKGKKAIEKYGEKAKDGVVIIKTKD